MVPYPNIAELPKEIAPDINTIKSLEEATPNNNITKLNHKSSLHNDVIESTEKHSFIMMWLNVAINHPLTITHLTKKHFYNIVIEFSHKISLDDDTTFYVQKYLLIVVQAKFSLNNNIG